MTFSSLIHITEGSGRLQLFLRANLTVEGFQVVNAPAVRGEEQANVEAGVGQAGDYLRNSFAVRRLLASIRHALCGGVCDPVRNGFGTVVVSRDVEINLEGRIVTRRGIEVKLTKIEFDILAVLARHAGKVVAHRQLLKEVWGAHAVRESHYVRVFMASLRKKLEDNPSRPVMLVTSQGVGYCLKT